MIEEQVQVKQCMSCYTDCATSNSFVNRVDKRVAEFGLDAASILTRSLVGNPKEVKAAKAIVAQVKANKYGQEDTAKMNELKKAHRDIVEEIVRQEMTGESMTGKADQISEGCAACKATRDDADTINDICDEHQIDKTAMDRSRLPDYLIIACTVCDRVRKHHKDPTASCASHCVKCRDTPCDIHRAPDICDGVIETLLVTQEEQEKKFLPPAATNVGRFEVIEITTEEIKEVDDTAAAASFKPYKCIKCDKQVNELTLGAEVDCCQCIECFTAHTAGHYSIEELAHRGFKTQVEAAMADDDASKRKREENKEDEGSNKKAKIEEESVIVCGLCHADIASGICIPCRDKEVADMKTIREGRNLLAAAKDEEIARRSLDDKGGDDHKESDPAPPRKRKALDYCDHCSILVGTEGRIVNNKLCCDSFRCATKELLA